MLATRSTLPHGDAFARSFKLHCPLKSVPERITTLTVAWDTSLKDGTSRSPSHELRQGEPSRLSELNREAQPRVGAAVLATMWNKWPTARRFQREGSCCLNCSPQAQDSIEHYACCPVIRSVASSSLRLELQPPPQAITNFLLITPPPSPDPTVTPSRRCLRMAILVTAAYNTTNAARHKPPRTMQETMDMLCQSLREAVRNHPVAMAELTSVWNTQSDAPREVGHINRRQRNGPPRPSPY